MSAINEKGRFDSCGVSLKIIREFEKGRARYNSYFDNIFEGQVEDVATSETVPSSTEFCYSRLFQRSDDTVQGRASIGGRMVG
jgi:hypothetical protein